MARKGTESRSIHSSEGAVVPPLSRRRTHKAASHIEAPAPETAEVPVAVHTAGPAEVAAPLVTMSDQEAIAKLAYSYWEARGYQHGSSEEDWLRAEQEYRRRQANA